MIASNLWSCEIDYSGWEDDVHHHHFFIAKDTKPTEEEVAAHYNATRYNPNDWHYDERIVPRQNDPWQWAALEPNDDIDGGYNATITIKPLELEELES